MDLRSLQNRLDRAAAAAQPRPGRPHRLTTHENRAELDRLVGLVDLMSGVAAVLSALEWWATWQPGYVVGPAPTNPDALDAARLVQLLAQYRSAGVADEAVGSALADFRARLAQFEASGKPIDPWYEKFLTPCRHSAAQSTNSERK